MTSAGAPDAADAVRAAVRAINVQLDEDLARLSDLAGELASVVAPSAIGKLLEADLADLVPLMRRRLDSAAAFVGLGFAAAPGVMADRDHYLLWFQKRSTGIRRLQLNLAENDPELYDYFDMEWFSGAERRQAPSLYGPYVDYAGADFLVLTLAVPVRVGGRFIGVSGADLDPDVLERRLVLTLRALPGDAVIVNADRSVLAAGSARWMPGERLAAHPGDVPDQWLATSALAPWTGWTLALAAPEGR
jgi:hypothetical protein